MMISVPFNAPQAAGAAEPTTPGAAVRDLVSAPFAWDWLHAVEAACLEPGILSSGRDLAHGAVGTIDVLRGELHAKIPTGPDERVPLHMRFATLAEADWPTLFRVTLSSVDRTLSPRLQAFHLLSDVRLRSWLRPSPRELVGTCPCSETSGLCKHLVALVHAFAMQLEQNPLDALLLRGVDESLWRELLQKPPAKQPGPQIDVDAAADRVRQVEARRASVEETLDAATVFRAWAAQSAPDIQASSSSGLLTAPDQAAGTADGTSWSDSAHWRDRAAEAAAALLGPSRPSAVAPPASMEEQSSDAPRQEDIRLSPSSFAAHRVRGELATVGRCFWENGRWWFRLDLEAGHLHGEKFSVPETFARHLQVPLRGELTLSNSFGSVIMQRRQGSCHGRLSRLPYRYRLAEGDYLFFSGNDVRLLARKMLRVEVSGEFGLGFPVGAAALRMTGFDRAVPSDRHAFSDLLGERLGMLGLENSDPQAIARLLKARGDSDILQALPPWLADQPALPASATATGQQRASSGSADSRRQGGGAPFQETRLVAAIGNLRYRAAAKQLRAGRVSRLQVSGDSASGSFATPGGELQVRVLLSRNELSGSCQCPLSSPNAPPCLHMDAVALAAAREGDRS
ncbi:SWIM zinc finger family protein [Streptomyces sp. NPDC056190]|uniref:SWIM zinc finger family protein n=1 Tax=Streptomyces sp. NPDC056190 TaxID=3345741 RepID=UPI0035DC8514